jgi:hypothetical protein
MPRPLKPSVIVAVVVGLFSSICAPGADDAQTPIWGVYSGNDPKDFTQYEQWLGKPAGAILGYTGGASWADYDGSVGWIMGVFSGLDRRVLWSVPLIPKGATLADAARGLYNDHYRMAAEKLAKWRPDEPVLYIRTAWEFNGDWFPWTAVGHPQDFIGAWRQFVDTFRSVSNRFRFDWCPSGGDKLQIPAEDAYPGDDYVDIIGLDIYDQEKWCKIKDPVERWNKVYLTGPYGLKWHQDFAATHRKPMSYPEWGIGGNDAGDNPFLIERMRQWFIDNKVVYATYWYSNSNYRGMLTADEYPMAAAKYKELFGK